MVLSAMVALVISWPSGIICSTVIPAWFWMVPADMLAIAGLDRTTLATCVSYPISLAPYCWICPIAVDLAAGRNSSRAVALGPSFNRGSVKSRLFWSQCDGMRGSQGAHPAGQKSPWTVAQLEIQGYGAQKRV